MNPKSLAHFSMEGVRGLLVAGIEGAKIDGILVLVGPVPAERRSTAEVVKDPPPVVHEVFRLMGVVWLNHEGEVGVGAGRPHGVTGAQEGFDVAKHPVSMIRTLDLLVGVP